MADREMLWYEMEVFGDFSDNPAENEVWVIGWDTYPPHSVLAGQYRKNRMDVMTEKEARERYPDISWNNKFSEPQVSLTHLPDTPDW